MPVPNAAQRIEKEVTSWPGVEAGVHRFGGREYRLGRREIGHVHGDHLVDVPFPEEVRDEVVAAGLAERHLVRPESGWVSRRLREEPDVEIAIALLRRSHTLALDHARKTGDAAGELDKVDEAGRESFPASDPPSWNP